MKKTSRSTILAVSLGISFLLAIGNVHALTITVTTVSDTVNSGDGVISLREAIQDTNNNPGADIIEFSPSLSGQTILLNGSQLSVSDSLVINGLGSSNLSIDARQLSRVLLIDDGNPSNFITVQVDGVTIVGGRVDGIFVGGGGILNYEQLTLDACTIQGNSIGELGDGGAGIRNNGGILTIIDSIVSNNNSDGTALQIGGGGILNDSGSLSIEGSAVTANSAIVYGGGIYIWNGTANIENSIIQGNSVTTNGQGGGIGNIYGTVVLERTTVTQNAANDITVASINGYGGGIYNSGNMTIIESTISSNAIRAGIGEVVLGGGIANLGTVSIIGSTIAYNVAGELHELGQGFYGGIYNGNTAVLVNSTVSGNVANEGVGGIGTAYSLELRNTTVSDNYDILGLYNIGGVAYAGTVTVANSIVANSHGDADLSNQGGTLLLRGANLIEDGSTGGVLTGDPNLSPLQDNGGPTFTRLPLTGSIVIDAGNNGEIALDTVDLDGDGVTSEPIPFDQRSTGFIRVSQGTVDLGALEVQPVDSDSDGIPDDVEITTCTNPLDADSDDDGIADGSEDINHNGVVDSGETDPCDIDSDGDGIQDGTESGETTGVADPDGAGPLLGTDFNIFVPDDDPSTTTLPTNPDTDGDGAIDGEEDSNLNGRVDTGESDPLDPLSTPIDTQTVPFLPPISFALLAMLIVAIGTTWPRLRNR